MIALRDTNGYYTEMRRNSIGNFFNNSIYFSPHCKLSSWQAKHQPTLLISADDWEYIKDENVTHKGAFGEDYREWDKETINDRWISGDDIRTSSWVIVWKFPGDLNHLKDEYGNNVYKKIYNIPLPVGSYSFYDDKWYDINIKNVASFPKNIKVEKMRIDVPSGNGIHYLENKNEQSVAMIGSHYFIKEFWKVTLEEKKRVVNMIKDLYSINIYAFPCYSQHHAIVFYQTVNDNELITPKRLAFLLSTQKEFSKIIEKYSYYSIKSWVSNYIKFVNSNLLDSVKSTPKIPNKETETHNYKTAIHKQSDPTGSLLRRTPDEDRNWVSDIPLPNHVQVNVGDTKGLFTYVYHKKLKGWVRTKYLTFELDV